ncbi:MAG TPA: hypothetical protein VKW04_02290 [Planctomycetota bacterium]|nr:hypothetical protein [Planctomycetota bacterium]
MPKCAKCGCNRILEHLHVLTKGESAEVTIQAWGNPQAVLFKDRASSPLEAAVCSECGFTELFVSDPKVLGQAVQRAENRQKSPG